MSTLVEVSWKMVLRGLELPPFLDALDNPTNRQNQTMFESRNAPVSSRRWPKTGAGITKYDPQAPQELGADHGAYDVARECGQMQSSVAAQLTAADLPVLPFFG